MEKVLGAQRHLFTRKPLEHGCNRCGRSIIDRGRNNDILKLLKGHVGYHVDYLFLCSDIKTLRLAPKLFNGGLSYYV